MSNHRREIHFALQFTRLAAVFSLTGGWTFLMYKPYVSSKMSGPKSQATNFSGGVEIVHLFC
jgi:hypothetical protein